MVSLREVFVGYLSAKNGKKWVNSFVAINSVLIGFISIRFLEQLSEWFDLEASITSFTVLKQVVGVLLGIVTYFLVTKNTKAVSHMDEVYNELQKVIWPEKNTVLKLTIGIMIAVSIVSGIFVLLDFTFQKLLELTY
jgi:preprotein translocase subunit SecE